MFKPCPDSVNPSSKDFGFLYGENNRHNVSLCFFLALRLPGSVRSYSHIDKDPLGKSGCIKERGKVSRIFWQVFTLPVKDFRTGRSLSRPLDPGDILLSKLLSSSRDWKKKKGLFLHDQIGWLFTNNCLTLVPEEEITTSR